MPFLSLVTVYFSLFFGLIDVVVGVAHALDLFRLFVRDLDADRPLLVTASAFLLVGDAKMLLEGRRILDK